MKGAREYCNLIQKAYHSKIGGLEVISTPGYGTGYKHKNLVFVLSEHARGKTFKIRVYQTVNIQDANRDDHLEVYGVIDGNPGWTESYGWLVEGPWKDYVYKYFDELREKLDGLDKKHKMQMERDKEKSDAERVAKIKQFDSDFRFING
jgi:hypothetical protein